jgi:hypothetical protein
MVDPTDQYNAAIHGALRAKRYSIVRLLFNDTRVNRSLNKDPGYKQEIAETLKDK